MIIKTSLPATGIDGIKAGDVYERAALTPDQITVLREFWRMQTGTIKDKGPHYNVVVIGFIARKNVNA